MKHWKDLVLLALCLAFLSLWAVGTYRWLHCEKTGGRWLCPHAGTCECIR